MPELDPLLVRIEADLGQFRRELNQAQGSAEQAARRIGRSFSDVLSGPERAGARLADLPSTGLGGQAALSGLAQDGARRLREAGEAARSLNRVARDLGFTFASAFEDAVVEGRRLSDVLHGLERDILRILTRKLVTEPLAGALSGAVGGGGGLLADLFHEGGRVGSTPISRRVVPANLFAEAPRFQGGGIAGRVPRLAPGEVPAILHSGETVRTPRQEAALARRLSGPAPVIHVTINTPDAPSFTASRGQIEAMLTDAVRRGQRNR